MTLDCLKPYFFLSTLRITWHKSMNQIEKRLHIAAKVTLFLPPMILLLIGLAIRLGMLDDSQPAVHQFIEIAFIVIFYLTPLAGLIILLLTVFVWRNRKANGLIFSPKQSLVYAGLTILSPIWLFILWLFIIGFNR